MISKEGKAVRVGHRQMAPKSGCSLTATDILLECHDRIDAMGLMGARVALAALLPWIPKFCRAGDAHDYLKKAARTYRHLQSFQVEAIAETRREVAGRVVSVAFEAVLRIPSNNRMISHYRLRFSPVVSPKGLEKILKTGEGEVQLPDLKKMKARIEVVSFILIDRNCSHRTCGSHRWTSP